MPKHKQRQTWNVKKMYEPVRLSQCMIVKNEEKNIEKALSWAKPYAVEQIIVDTGSTDRTVEIAKSMGAKVFYFKWINDFAAAKNFAIEKAKGNWIAFLDADEYFSAEGAKDMFECLKKMQATEDGHLYDFVRCSWAHLSDAGKPFMVNIQDRIFRNDPAIRYRGSIHEQIARNDGRLLTCIDKAGELTIFHTGYMQQAFSETNKANRNVELLREAIVQRPDDVSLYGYLGEALFVAKEYDESEKMLRKLIEAGDKASIQRRKQAFAYIGRILEARQASNEEIEAHYREALKIYPNHYDYLLSLAMILKKMGSYSQAMEYFDKCEDVLKSSTDATEAYAISRPDFMYSAAIDTASALLDKKNTVKYATLLLRVEKFTQHALVTFLKCLYPENEEHAENEAVFRILGQLYDFTSLKDKLFVLKCVKLLGCEELAGMILAEFTGEETEWFNEKLSEKLDPRFEPLMREIAVHSEDGVYETLKNNFNAIKPENYGLMLDSMQKLGYWSPIDPKNGIYTALSDRAKVLKERHADFVWLYRRLEDVRSKNVLNAIMRNWALMDFRELIFVKEKECPDYFDQELFYCGHDEVFVDAGAYNGDTSYSYLKTYGEYEKIYCYEPTPALFEELSYHMGKYKDMELRQRAVGERDEERFLLADGCDGALNRVVTEKTEIPVQVVSLDDDIPTPVTFIKMDVEGMELEALRGSKRHITEERPKLAISAYHSYADVVDIARSIVSMNPDYKLYLRYYGGNLLPSEFVLLAVNAEPEIPDWRFHELMLRIENSTVDDLLLGIKQKYSRFPASDREVFAKNMARYKFGGAFNPDEDVYESFENCAKMLKERCNGLNWLYDRLNDARSKNVLFAILSGWADMDVKLLANTKETKFPSYFDGDIIMPAKDEVFVDVGAFNGDTARDFITTYGNYKQMYCYEITPGEFGKLVGFAAKYPNIVCRNKAVSSAGGIMKLNINEEASGNTLSEDGEIEIELVSLDDDISEPVTFIKMDIEGMEKEALKGASRHIREDKPKLAICIYHGYEDLVKIPRMILDMNPDYKLYLRYYGGDFFPTEYVLYAV